MTLGTHVIPVLIAPRPVQLIAWSDVLIGIKMEPAHSAIGRRASVPGEWQGLHTTSGKLDEVLLQRSDAEGVGDSVFLVLSVGVLRRDIETIVTCEESGLSTEVVELSIAEVTKNSRLIGYLDGELMV